MDLELLLWPRQETTCRQRLEFNAPRKQQGSTANGSGLFADSDVLAVINSTISGNLADNHGGGAYVVGGSNPGDVTIAHNTIVRNTSDADESGDGSGGGVFVSSGHVSVGHTIVAENADQTSIGPDVTGFLGVTLDVYHSLIGDNTGTGLTEAPIGSPDIAGNLIGGPLSGTINPLLGPLAANGGPTLTHALQVGSPAIDGGDVAIASLPASDQRGAPFVRIFGAAIDIGAYERQSLAPMTLVVDIADDEVDANQGPGDLSLREAIGLANGSVDTHDTIEFSAELTGQTILLGLGELLISDDLTINGPGSDDLTIDASGNDPEPEENSFDGSRLFSLETQSYSTGFQPAMNVEINGLTLTGGDTGDSGGAIHALSNLSLTDVTIVGNNSLSGGGIHFLNGNLDIYDSAISNNRVTFSGGAIEIVPSFGTVVVTIERTTVSDNTAIFAPGGGIFSQGTVDLTIADSTISGNSVLSSGGGIAVHGPGGELTVRNSTISGNSAGSQGGGLRLVDANLSVAHSTITQNTVSSQGGGIYSNSDVEIQNSIVAGNTATGPSVPVPSDIGGSATVVSTFSLLGVDPLLGPLAGNGGPTLTHALLPSSPAINAGDPDFVAPPDFDQRGSDFDRVTFGRIDIGAVELDAASPAVTADFDTDGIVGGLDFLAWQRGFGTTVTATLGDGDATGDNNVTGGDRSAWEAAFGEIVVLPMVEEPLVAAAQLPSLLPQVSVLPVAKAPSSDLRAELIDAAIAIEWMDGRLNPEELPVAEQAVTRETARDFALALPDLIPATTASAEIEVSASHLAEEGDSAEAWLTDHMLERVSG